MTDYMTVPAAGWYTDPSNPGQERWWGGVEWTNDVRPLAVPAPTVAPPLMTQPTAAAQPFVTQPVVAQPAPAQAPLAQVPGGGINPFAEIDAQERMLAVGSYDFGLPATASTTTAGGSYGSYGSYPTGSVATAPTMATVDPGWYTPTPSVQSYGNPKNGVATAGLILSLLGFGLVAVIVSAIGLRKARNLELQGDAPVGRKRSRWGIGLGIVSFLITVAITVGYLFFYQAIYSYFTQLTGIAAETQEPQGGMLDGLALPDVSTGNEVTDGSYDRGSYEQSIRDDYATKGYPAPDSVTCPDQGSTEAGSTVVCTIVTGDLTETRTTQYLGGGDYSTVTISAP